MMRNQQLIGISMNSSYLSSLADIYQSLKEGVQQTSYILQFIWRDLTSEFDIIGPYFTYSKSMESKFLHACLIETISLFHDHGLKTSLIICDGASTVAELGLQ
jgi:hypothetical protein